MTQTEYLDACWSSWWKRLPQEERDAIGVPWAYVRREVGEDPVRGPAILTAPVWVLCLIPIWDLNLGTDYMASLVNLNERSRVQGQQYDFLHASFIGRVGKHHNRPVESGQVPVAKGAPWRLLYKSIDISYADCIPAAAIEELSEADREEFLRGAVEEFATVNFSELEQKLLKLIE